MKPLLISLLTALWATALLRSTRFDFLDLTSDKFDISWDKITENMWPQSMPLRVDYSVKFMIQLLRSTAVLCQAVLLLLTGTVTRLQTIRYRVTDGSLRCLGHD